MTITELIANFRGALLGVQPSVEKVGIPWKRPDAYDEWDELAGVLYRTLVVDAIRARLPEADQERFRMPEYDLLLPDYGRTSFLELMPSAAGRPRRVFHALGTRQTPFDTVEWRAVSTDGTPQAEQLEMSPFDGAAFRLRLLGSQGDASILDMI